MDPLLIGMLAFFGTTLGGVAFLVIRLVRAEQAKVLSALRRLPGVARDAGHAGTGTLDSKAYRYELTEGTKSRPVTFTLAVDGSPGPAFTVRRETAFDRRAKAIGLAQGEDQTGDRAFDAEFYVETESGGDDQVSFRLTATHQAAIRSLFALDPESVRHDGNAISVTWSGKAAVKAIDPATARTALEPLLSLAHAAMARTTSPRRAGSPGAGRRLGRTGVRIFVGIATPVPVLFFIGLQHFCPLDAWQSGIAGVGYGAIALVVFLGVAGFCLQGRSTSHHELALLAWVAVLVFPPGAAGILWIVNAGLDGAPAVSRTATVVDRYRTGKGDATHMIAVESWRRPGAHEHLEVSAAIYDASEPGRTRVSVGTKPGVFGYEWVATEVQVAHAAPPVAVAGVTAPAAPEPIPETARGYVDRGVRRLQGGRPTEAVADFKRAIDLDPLLVDAYRQLDNALMPSREWDTIIHYWTRLIERSPDLAEAYYERGGAKLHKGDRKGALADAAESCRRGFQDGCRVYEKYRTR